MSNNLFKGVALFVGLAISLGILVVGVLSLRSYFTRASTSSDPKNIRTANITSNNASVLWDTEKESQGIARYSTDPAAFNTGNSSGLLFAAEAASTTKHEVKLNLLKPDTTYYFEIAIATNIYDQSGLIKNDKHLPYTFTTAKTTKTETEGTPTLDVEIFKQKFGSSDSLYDLNKDGVVNATDYLLYLLRTASPTP